LGRENSDGDSQTFIVCGPVPKTLDTCGLLLINRVLQHHGRDV